MLDLKNLCNLIEIKLNTSLENTGKIFISLVLQTSIVLWENQSELPGWGVYSLNKIIEDRNKSHII